MPDVSMQTPEAKATTKKWRQSHLSQKPALELIKQIDEGLLNPRNLHRPERLNIVDMLRAEGWGQAKISLLLKCSHRTVKRDIRQLKARNRHLVTEYTRERVANESIAMADGLRQKAIAKGDIDTAWRITKELPELIQSLGLLPKAPLRIEGSMTIADLLASAATQAADVDLRRL